MTDTTRVIYFAVDKHKLTIYKEDGETVVIDQGDPRVRPLVDKLTPDINEQGYSDIPTRELTGKEPMGNHYAEAEDGLGGLVKFFRIFKDSFQDLQQRFEAFVEADAKALVPSMEVGSKPAVRLTEEAEETKPLTKSQVAVNEVLANAIPAKSPEFRDEKPYGGRESTIVAVMDDGTIIPDMENLDGQLRGLAAKLGSLEGIGNFFRRLASVKRAHSVKDLLTFMEKGELPIADDGSVLVYKLLKSTSEEGVFVDCHTGKVKQKVGSMVFMDEKLVDTNRSQDCSNGLHVARRDYLHSFGGNVCVLAKLAPEDVIAVPHGDARKLRAKGYHIIAQLTNEDRDNVRGNRPLQDKALLGNAAAGNHVPVTQMVEITGQQGTGVVIVDLDVEHVIREDSGRRSESLETVAAAEPLDLRGTGEQVDPTKLAKAVIAEKSGGVSTRAIRAQELLKAMLDAPEWSQESVDAATALFAFKKAAKKGWAALGLSDVDGSTAESIIISGVKVVEPPKAKKPTKVEGADGELSIEAYMEQSTGSPKERIQRLLTNGTLTTNAARAVMALKKTAKKSWEVLGVTEKQLKVIIKLTK